MSSTQTQQSPKAVILGGGPVGSMMALFLAKKHSHLFPGGIEIYERRKDSRKQDVEAGRSINLAISSRTFCALDAIDKGLVPKLIEKGVKMFGRYMHDRTGTKFEYQPYGKPGEYILSIDRTWINEFILTQAENCEQVKIFFEQKASNVDLLANNPTVHFEDGASVSARVVFGADGLNSIVRQSIQKTPKSRMNFSQTYIANGYKELCIRPKDGKFVMRDDCLHIWPRGDFMMIALPNPTKDFTATLFMNMHGKENSFQALTSDEKIIEFFKKEFPDALALIGEKQLLADWHKNPTSDLSYLKLDPFHYNDKAVLLGDAAHAVVPFYGQGCNAGIEGCRILSEILSTYLKDEKSIHDHELVQKAFEEFTRIRKPSADAVCDLALQNMVEMASKTASKTFLLQKKFGLFLHKLMPDTFKPLYTMVTFSPQIPYKEAWETHLARERTLTKIVKRAQYVVLGTVLAVGIKYAWPYATEAWNKYIKK